jgi:hypothetical protein
MANKQNYITLINKFNLLFRSIKVSNIEEFNNLFRNFIYKSGIEKYLDKSLKRIKYPGKFKFYYNLIRLKNSPIKLLNRDINRLYLDKFKL